MSKLDAAMPEPDVEDSTEMPQANWSNKVELDQSQLTIPWLQLVQANSKLVTSEKAKFGDWYVEGFGAFREVTFVPLLFAMSRRFSVQDPEDKDALVTACMAPTDAPANLHGIIQLPERMPEGTGGMPCKECPLSHWRPSDKVVNGRKQNDPPLCQEAYQFQGFSLEHGIPVKVAFRSGSNKAGRLIATLGQSKGLGNFAVRLGFEKATGKFVFARATVEILKDDEAQAALGESQLMALTA